MRVSPVPFRRQIDSKAVFTCECTRGSVVTNLSWVSNNLDSGHRAFQCSRVTAPHARKSKTNVRAADPNENRTAGSRGRVRFQGRTAFAVGPPSEDHPEFTRVTDGNFWHWFHELTHTLFLVGCMDRMGQTQSTRRSLRLCPDPHIAGGARPDQNTSAG